MYNIAFRTVMLLIVCICSIISMITIISIGKNVKEYRYYSLQIQSEQRDTTNIISDEMNKR